MTSAYASIEHDLKSLLRGECFFDTETRERYSTAASWYTIMPVGVVFPHDVEDVQTVVRFCSENDIAIIPRGGGSGLAGQAVGLGVVLDFTKHMHGVVSYDEATVTVQPGIVLHSLNECLARHDRMFPIDPASSTICTIGGMIATNAAGAHGPKYGATKDHVEAVTVVLANGEIAHLGKNGVASSPNSLQLFEDTRTLLEPYRELIRERFPRVAKNSSGYNLLDTIGFHTHDPRKLIVGSEGTLAIVIEATVNLVLIPKHRTGVVAFFHDDESAARATLAGLSLEPSAVEFLDRTYFSLGRSIPGSDGLVRDDAQVLLYFECEGDDASSVSVFEKKIRSVIAPAQPLEVRTLDNESKRQSLWQLREHVSRILNFDEVFQKASFIEDVAVPIPQLPTYLEGLRAILHRFGIQCSIYGHAGSGNVHCAAFVNLGNLDHYRAIDMIASEVNDLAIALGGTLSGEHGDGFVRTPYLERLYGSAIYRLFGEIKYLFDPRGILNPGKIIGPQNTTILHDIALV